MWPLQMTDVGGVPEAMTERFMRRERRRLRAQHIWEGLDLDWDTMKDRLFTPGPTGHSGDKLYEILFCSTRRTSGRWQEAVYRGPGEKQVKERYQQVVNQFLAMRHMEGPMALDMSLLFSAFEERNEELQEQVAALQKTDLRVWRTRKGWYWKKQPDVRDVHMQS